MPLKKKHYQINKFFSGLVIKYHIIPGIKIGKHSVTFSIDLLFFSFIILLNKIN